VTVPPLVFVAEVLLVLALAATAVAVALGSHDRPRFDLGAMLGERGSTMLSRQQELAQGLGLTLRAWLSLRLGVTSVGLVLGATTGIVAAVLVGGLGGFFGVPWALWGVAASRRLRMERALGSFAISVRNLMRQSNLALDRALREAARAPGPELTHVLAPLSTDASVPEALSMVANRARSPLADLLLTALLVARTHNPLAMVRVTDEVLLPLMEKAVAVQEENQTTVAQQRAAAAAIGIIMAILFAAVVRVPTMHVYYQSGAGQLVLLTVVGMYVALVWMLGRVARPIQWVEWDVDAVRREAEALVA